MLKDQHAVANGLAIRTKRVGRVQVITLRGRLELANWAVAESQLEMALRDGEAQVVVDLRELELIDAAGVALLSAAFPRDRVKTLRLIPGQAPDVARVLESHGIDGRAMLVDPRPAMR
jgi:anti-anti-sigma factor